MHGPKNKKKLMTSLDHL